MRFFDPLPLVRIFTQPPLLGALFRYPSPHLECEHHKWINGSSQIWKPSLHYLGPRIPSVKHNMWRVDWRLHRIAEWLMTNDYDGEEYCVVCSQKCSLTMQAPLLNNFKDDHEVWGRNYWGWHSLVSKVLLKVFLGIPPACWLRCSCSAARQQINCRKK